MIDSADAACAARPSRRAHSSYRHEALLYRGEADFLAGTVPFVRDGIEAGEPVLVAVTPQRMRPLQEALDGMAGAVSFVDMTEAGRNPARLAGLWDDFVRATRDSGRPVRGIGEPVHSGRRPVEVAECQLHEALLNLVVEPDVPLWLRCPYDVTGLDDAVVSAIDLSHPVAAETDGDYRGSTRYGGAHHARALFTADLLDPPGAAASLAFDGRGRGLDAVKAAVRRHAAAAGLTDDRADDLVLALHEVATNSVVHGGGDGTLSAWSEPGALVLEVRDTGRIDDLLVGRIRPTIESTGGRGVWLANQLCDLVQLRSSAGGTTVRITTWL